MTVGLLDVFYNIFSNVLTFVTLFILTIVVWKKYEAYKWKILIFLLISAFAVVLRYDIGQIKTVYPMIRTLEIQWIKAKNLGSGDFTLGNFVVILTVLSALFSDRRTGLCQILHVATIIVDSIFILALIFI